MNKDIIKGKWNQLKGQAKAQWSKLTDDELDEIAGEFEKMVGKLQEKYGFGRAKAEEEANKFFDKNN